MYIPQTLVCLAASAAAPASLTSRPVCFVETIPLTHSATAVGGADLQNSDCCPDPEIGKTTATLQNTPAQLVVDIQQKTKFHATIDH